MCPLLIHDQLQINPFHPASLGGVFQCLYRRVTKITAADDSGHQPNR